MLSVGCAFTGGASAETCWGQGKTYRLDPCGTYAMVSLDYKTGGTWYGPYYTYQWNNYLYAADQSCSTVPTCIQSIRFTPRAIGSRSNL